MKTIISCICLLILTLYSCDKQNITDINGNKKLTNQQTLDNKPEEEATSSKMFVPEGSVFESIDEGHTKITPPNGWDYVFKTQEDPGLEARMGTNAPSGISCTCTLGGTGCHPGVTEQGVLLCMMTSPCEECKKNNVTTYFNNEIIAVDKGSGYINRALGINFVVDEEVIPNGFEAIFELSELNDSIRNFETKIYGSISIPNIVVINGQMEAPSGFGFAKINAFGRLFLMLVPSGSPFLPSSINLLPKIECSCDDGTCTPVVEGSIAFCKAYDCVGTCTLRIVGEVGTVPLDNVEYFSY